MREREVAWASSPCIRWAKLGSTHRIPLSEEPRQAGRVKRTKLRETPARLSRRMGWKPIPHIFPMQPAPPRVTSGHTKHGEQTNTEDLSRRPGHRGPGSAAEQSQGHRPRPARWQTHRLDRSERIGQIEPRLPDPLRRGTAPLRRDLLALHAAVLRPHGQTAGRFDQRHPARHRHRAAECGEVDPLHRRHDHGDQRLPEAPLPASRAGLRSRQRRGDLARLTRVDPAEIDRAFWIRQGAPHPLRDRRARRHQGVRFLRLPPAAGLPARLALRQTLSGRRAIRV